MGPAVSEPCGIPSGCALVRSGSSTSRARPARSLERGGLWPELRTHASDFDAAWRFLGCCNEARGVRSWSGRAQRDGLGRPQNKLVALDAFLVFSSKSGACARNSDQNPQEPPHCILVRSACWAGDPIPAEGASESISPLLAPGWRPRARLAASSVGRLVADFTARPTGLAGLGQTCSR